MKKIIISFAALSALCGCSEKIETFKPETIIPSVILADVSQFAQAARAKDNSAVNYSLSDYLTSSPGMDTLQVLIDDKAYMYYYDQGVFKYKRGPLDQNFELDGLQEMPFFIAGQNLTFGAMWPAKPELKQDQSTWSDFLQADILMTRIEAPQTDTVSVSLDHFSYMITFTLGGKYAGQKIAALQWGEFKAYCDPSASVRDARIVLNYAVWSDISEDMTGMYGTVTLEEGGSLPFILKDDAVKSAQGGQNITVTLNL